MPAKNRNAGARRRRGFVLVTAGAGALVLAGGLGMSIDLGRMYIVRTEAQSFVDSSALRAALELDGTTAGLTRAAAVPASSTNKWDFGSRTYTGVTTRFATSAAGPWPEAVAAPLLSNHVRIAVNLSVPLYVLPLVTRSTRATVAASAVAGQVAKTSFSEGLFPFSPFAHDTGRPDFGLTKGQLYTLRWAHTPRLGTGSTNVCPGDRDPRIVDMSDALSSSERGYIESPSASELRATIEADYQTVTRTIGDVVDFTGGTMATLLSSLHRRIEQDTDSTSVDYAAYLAGGRGNGRRIVACALNDGGSPVGTNNRIVGVGAFFLQHTGGYGSGANDTWCAEYIGSWLQGSDKPGVGVGGALVVRLVQ
jgi:Flp pilus assembly protein TadG